MIISVTVLTSIDQRIFEQELGMPGTIQDKVKKWAVMTQKAGLDGVVASPREIQIIREACGTAFKIITPGIRPSWSVSGDQKRIMTPARQFNRGHHTWLCVGP